MKKIFIFISCLLCLLLTTVTKVSAANGTPSRIEIDQTYLSKAVVSSNPLEIGYNIYDSDSKYCYGYDVTFSIVTGQDCAEIVDNKLVVKKAGSFVLRGRVKDTQVSSDVTVTSYNIELSNLTLLNKFENITVYTQPIKLQTAISVKLTTADSKRAQSGDQHFLTNYRVVSGNAEIYLNQYLKITGTGEVVVEASSIYDDNIKVQKTFNVTDPDAGKDLQPGTVLTQKHVVTTALAVGFVLIAVTTTLVYINKKQY